MSVVDTAQAHTACQARETDAWRQALREAERRKRAEWWVYFWRGQAIVGWIAIARWWFGW